MASASTTTLPESIDALKALAGGLIEQLAQHTDKLDHQSAQLKEQSALIEKLKFELARLRRWRFGASSESLNAEQLALWAAELEGDIAAAETRLDEISTQRAPIERRIPKRERLPEHLPRLEVRHELPSTDCPQCGQGWNASARRSPSSSISSRRSSSYAVTSGLSTAAALARACT